MTYIDCIRRSLVAELPSLTRRPELLDYYVLLTLTKGSKVTLSDVHDAWSVWKMGIDTNHPAIVPFGRLEREIQEKDRKYSDAIARVAEKLKEVNVMCDWCGAGCGDSGEVPAGTSENPENED